MNCLKKHVHTVIVLGALFISFLLIRDKFNDSHRKIICIEKDLSVIKAAFGMKNIMQMELAKKKGLFYGMDTIYSVFYRGFRSVHLE